MSEQFELEYPIDFNGAQRSYLNIRRPKVKDLELARKAKGDAADQEMQLFSQLCEVSVEELGELDAYDYERLQEHYAGFFTSRNQSEKEKPSAKS